MLAMFAFRIMLILILILAFIIISNVMFERRKQKGNEIMDIVLNVMDNGFY